MRFNLGLILHFLVLTTGTAFKCTEGGAPWTPEEYAEYLTLNNTTGWAPMKRLKHCYLDQPDSDSEPPRLELRGGNNKYIAYSSTGCQNVLFSVDNFGCGGCWSVGQSIESGYLWRQTTGNPYPTVDYFDSPTCNGNKVHHQGIFSGQFSSCDNVLGLGAASVIVYQGC